MYLHTNLLSVVDLPQRPLSAQPVFAPRLRDCSHGFLSAPSPHPPTPQFTRSLAVPMPPYPGTRCGYRLQARSHNYPAETQVPPPPLPHHLPPPPPPSRPHIQVDKDRLDPPPPRLIPTRDTIYALPVCVLNTCCSVSDPIGKKLPHHPRPPHPYPFPDTHLPIYLGGQGQTGP